MRKTSEKLTADRSALIYLIGFCLYALGSVLCGMLEGDLALYVGYAVPQVAFMGTIVAYGLYKGQGINDLVPVTKVKPKPIALAMCVPLTIGIMMQNYFLATGFSWLMNAAGVKMSVSVPSLDGVGFVLLAILFLAALPAIGEESMYRGVWVSGLGNQCGQKTAIILSALIFSLSHLNPAQLVHQFLLGILLAYIASETGSVVYGMIIHFLNNTLAIVLPILIPAINTLDVYSWQNLLILMAVSLVGVAVLYPSLYFTMQKASLHGNVNIFKFLFKKNDMQMGEEGKPQAKGFMGYIAKVGYWTPAVVVILVILSIVTIVISVQA